jgi:hypothetical protein
MNTRAAALIALTTALLGLTPAVSAADVPAGTLEDASGGPAPVVTDHGEDDTYLVLDGADLFRWHVGDDAFGLSIGRDQPIAPDLFASDPRNDDVVFTQDDRVRRISDGHVTTIAEGLFEIRAMDVGPDGSAYVAYEQQVDRIDIAGARVTVARELYDVRELSVAADGTVVVADGSQLKSIRGTIVEPLAGSTFCGFLPNNPCGDGEPWLEARFGDITVVEHGPDGSIYVGDSRGRVRALRPNGIVEPVAGSWGLCANEVGTCGVGSLGPLTRLDPITGLAIVGDDLYISELENVPGNARVTVVRDVADMPYVEPRNVDHPNENTPPSLAIMR